jgi:thioredoxin 1
MPRDSQTKSSKIEQIKRSKKQEELSKRNELQEKIQNGDKLVVDFFANWCGPCLMMKPTFEKLTNENTTEIGMYTMDVDHNRELAIELGIRSVPTIKVFNGGGVVGTKVGVLKEGEIKELMTELING